MRPAFDAFFDEAFSLVPADAAGKRRRVRGRAGGSPGAVGGQGRGGGTSSAARQSPAARRSAPRPSVSFSGGRAYRRGNAAPMATALPRVRCPGRR
ncbi:MAG: hypothetical protein U0807_13425 [Candidatus Binatia bacterium]